MDLGLGGDGANVIAAGHEMKGFSVRRFCGRAICGLCAWGLAAALSAQAAMDVDREFAFASGLVELGFADYANRVVQNVLRLHPGEQQRATRIQGEILIAQRRFKEAEELVATMPEEHAQRYALQLRIANGLFRAGEVEEARRLYEAFFADYADEAPEDPDLLEFFQDAAYRYGQMLERMGDRAGAVAAYRRLLAAGLDDSGAQRRLMHDVARLLLRLGRDAEGDQRKEYLDQAFAMADEITWGGYDLWFGHAISTMAHVELARDNEAGARELLLRYRSDLNRLDQVLREQNVPPVMSPVAAARFLLGELHEKEARALRERGAPEAEVLPVIQQALTEFYNVFGRYGMSEWGGEAGMRGRALVALLEGEYGRRVNVDFGDHVGQAAQAQFTHADDLFRQRDYPAAIKEYLRILNAFPEGEPSLRALANLLLSYVRSGDELHARMVAEYLAERFAGDEIAARALLIGGREYVEKDNEEMYYAFFDIYFSGFPEHERAPALLFDMARRREAVGERAAAMGYYQRIVENYPRDRNFLRALFAMAISSHEIEDYEQAIEYLTRYVAEAPPGHERVRAQFLVGDSYQRLQQYPQAVQAYGQLLRWLRAEDAPDNARPEDAERNARFAERALFFVGYNLARAREPAERIPDFRDRAITTYAQFLERHPESSLAPTAMRDKGAIQLELERSTEAAATFEALAERYPDSEEGRSALFALVSAAFEIDRPDIARDAFRRMMRTPEDHSAEEFTRIGQLMLDNGLYEEVIPAYRRVVDSTDERRMLELAKFGLGSAYHHQGEHEQAVTVFTELIERFPNTAYLFDARFLLAAAHRDLAQYREARRVLGDILRVAPDNLTNQRAQFKLAEVQQLEGDRNAALASFQRIALLQDPTDRELRPIIEQSLWQSLELMMELELYQDVEDVSVQYLDDFAQGSFVDEVRRMRADARRRAVQ